MSKQFPHPFGDIAKKYRKFRQELTTVVSVMAANTFKENFREGGYEGDAGGRIKWAKRKGDGGSSRGVLVKSGRLKRSLRPAANQNEARVVTNVPYAQAHNEGFEGTVQVKAHTRHRYSSHTVSVRRKVSAGRKIAYQTKVIKMRDHLNSLHKAGRGKSKTAQRLHKRIKDTMHRAKGYGQKTVKQKSGSIRVKPHSRKVRLKARPFMITTAPLLNRIDTYVGDTLDRIFNQSINE
jgi:phage gpG-like protein